MLLLPFPSLIRGCSDNQAYKNTVNSLETRKNAYSVECEREKLLNASVESASNKIKPFKINQEIQNGIINSISSLTRLADGKVWIKHLKIYPKITSKELSKLKREQPHRTPVNTHVIECEMKIQAASYQSLERSIELIKSQSWTSEFSIKNASSLEISSEEFKNNLTLGAIDKQNSYGKKNVDAIIIFKVI
ncbi:MAG: hypothetical protein ACYTFY_20815 [Planctomycetota bacterium]|jgi:hypothetical protein